MECLCRYRFCYKCGAAGGSCGCNPGHMFLSDLECENDGMLPHVADSPIRDTCGRVDIGSCVRRRDIRLERRNRAEEKWTEAHWQWSPENHSVCTFNRRWMFSSNINVRNMAKLTQQLRHEEVKCEHESYKDYEQQHYHPQNATWLFLRHGSDAQAMEQLLIRDNIQGERDKRWWNAWADNEDHDVTFLFLRRGADIQVMNDLFNREEIAFERLSYNECRTYEDENAEVEGNLSSLWLYLPRDTGLKILSGLDDAVEKRWEREFRRQNHSAIEKSMDIQRDLSSLWLYLPRDTGLRILLGLNDAVQKRVERASRAQGHSATELW
jgi:hypothetical protein